MRSVAIITCLILALVSIVAGDLTNSLLWFILAQLVQINGNLEDRNV